MAASYENIHFSKSPIRIQPLILSLGRKLGSAGGGRFDLHAGLGGTNVTAVETGRQWRIGTRWGLGWQRHLASHLLLGASLDHNWAAPGDSHTRHEVHAIALAVSLGFGGAMREEPALMALPADDDSDGVANRTDRCPNTPKGSPVTAYGCLKTDKVEIRLNVEFETSKDEVRANFDPQLKETADFLKAYPEVHAAIEGHTDDVGPEEANLELSKRRAASVRQALIDRFGADAARLSAEGYGESRPIADNKDDTGRARNRRVVAVFTAQ